MPDNMMQIIMQLIASVTPLIGTAELAFSGKPGSGEAKKQLVLASIGAGMTTANLIKPNLLTSEQQAAILKSSANLVNDAVDIMNTVKLFEVPASIPPKPVV